MLDKIYYIVQDNGKKFGPLSYEDLKDNHIIFKDTYIWKEGLSDWVPAETLDEIQELVRTRPPLTERERRERNIKESTQRIQSVFYKVFDGVISVLRESFVSIILVFIFLTFFIQTYFYVGAISGGIYLTEEQKNNPNLIFWDWEVLQYTLLFAIFTTIIIYFFKAKKYILTQSKQKIRWLSILNFAYILLICLWAVSLPNEHDARSIIGQGMVAVLGFYLFFIVGTLFVDNESIKLLVTIIFTVLFVLPVILVAHFSPDYEETMNKVYYPIVLSTTIMYSAIFALIIYIYSKAKKLDQPTPIKYYR